MKGIKGFQKGYTPWNKDKTLSEETKQKMSKSHSGKTFTEEHKRKIGEAQRGKIVSLESRKKMSRSQKESIIGKINRAKLAESRRGKPSIMYGEKNPMWKGGTTPLIRRIRKCLQYNNWRYEGFKRDDFTCSICLRKGVALHFDHYPKSFSQVFYENNIKTFEQALNCDDFWDIKNGRTLCVDCHRKTDNYGTRPK